MTEKLQLYRCEICGNIVQVLSEGADALVCCGEEMKLLDIQHDSTELGEKHNPKLEEKDGRKYVHVKTHPMTKEHYIEFIQVQSKDKKESCTKFFNPDEIPEVDITNFSGDMTAVEYCNIHHLWGMNEERTIYD